MKQQLFYQHFTGQSALASTPVKNLGIPSKHFTACPFSWQLAHLEYSKHA